MQDAGDAVDQAARQSTSAPANNNESGHVPNSTSTTTTNAHNADGQSNNAHNPDGQSNNAHDGGGQPNDDHGRKRKRDFPDTRQKFGGKGGRNNGKRHQKGDMGRGEHLYVFTHMYAA